jgi:iron complex outermembrane receptor protein
MKPTMSPLALALLAAFSSAACAQDAPIHQLGTVTISGNRPTSLPTQIPTTIEDHHQAKKSRAPSTPAMPRTR